MAKVYLPYSAENNLAEYIKQSSEQKGITITKEEENLAEFCKLTKFAIRSYKQGETVPSLPVALKIAEYYHDRVESIFNLV